MRNIRKEYSPTAGPHGQSTAKNLRYWANRASENSECAPRARGGEVRLPDAGGDVKLPRTSAPPRRKANVDAAMVDGPRRGYLPGVKRHA